MNYDLPVRAFVVVGRSGFLLSLVVNLALSYSNCVIFHMMVIIQTDPQLILVEIINVHSPPINITSVPYYHNQHVV